MGPVMSQDELGGIKNDNFHDQDVTSWVFFLPLSLAFSSLISLARDKNKKQMKFHG